VDQLWGEYVPNWIAAVSTALAFIAAGIAAMFAWRSLQGESKRDERRQAHGLSAWWVTGHFGERQVWGILISNSASATFHDVSIEAVGNDNPKAGRAIDLRTVPPGRYLVESLSKSSSRAWGSKVPIAHDTTMQPLMDANTRNVRSIDFTDSSGLRWRWTPSTGLQRTNPVPAAGAVG
jgi:hypothetical protein